jgi:hypothetical protein
MSDFQIPWHRYATITALTEQTRSGLGRTALMKLCYFLQVLRQVDLGYDFRLYTYGPFDSQVLDDLSYAEFLDAVDEKTVHYPNGQGYIVRSSDQADVVKQKAATFLEENETHLNWVIREFGTYSAAELELLSTMVFVDREAAHKDETLLLPELVRRVLQVKPHVTEEYALRLAQVLVAKAALRAVPAADRVTTL